MIILEGPDNSGKSTLGAKLAEFTGWPVVHSSSNHPKGPDEMYLVALEQLVPKPQILDRVFSVSEAVYGPLIRGRNRVGVLNRVLLRTLVRSQNLIIYCRPPEMEILNTSKDEMDGVVENHAEIIRRYDKLFNTLDKCGASIYRHDHTRPNAQFIVESIVHNHVRQFKTLMEKENEFSAYL